MKHRTAILFLSAICLLPALGGCLLRAGATEAQIHQQAIDLHAEGVALEEMGRWREAIVKYEHSITLSESPAAHCRLGVCHRELGNLESAQNHFQRALELSPSYALAETHLLQIEDQLRVERQMRGSVAQSPSPATAPAPEEEPVVVAQTPVAPPTTEAVAPPPPSSPAPPPTPEPVPVPEVEESSTPAPIPASEPEVVRENERVTAPEPHVTPEAGTAPPAAREISEGTGVGLEEMPAMDEVRALLFPGIHGNAEISSGAERLRQTRLDSPEFHMAQAEAYESENDLASALREYRMALSLDTTRVAPLLAIAEIQERLGHEDEALSAYERALETAPSDPEVPFQLGNHFFRLDEHERSLTFYEQALRLDSRHRGAHNNMGAALRELGRPEEAISHLEEAIEIDPTYAAPHRNLGNVQTDLGHDREALEAYREYVRLGGRASAEVRGWIRELEQRLGE